MGRPFGGWGEATAVNDRGQVAGFGPNGPNYAFLYDRGRYTDVGADVLRQVPGSTFTQAYGHAASQRAQVLAFTANTGG